MAQTPYFAKYAVFATKTKNDGSALMNADNVVGDAYELTFAKDDDGNEVVWLRNRFGHDVGFFEDAKTTYDLQLCRARGWKMQAMLAGVYFSDAPDPGRYWGEAAILCYDPLEAASFDVFAQGVGAMLADGVRPKVELDAEGVQKVLESKGTWRPSDREPPLREGKGTASLKTRRTLNDKLVEQARVHRIGCTVAGWAAMLAVVGLVALVVRSCAFVG